MKRMEVTQKQLDGEYRNIGLYTDNAKTYIQLSTGALLLSVTFSESISGQSSAPIREIYLWISWLGWLGAILAGATYQYCAAKYLEALEKLNKSLVYARRRPFMIWEYWIRRPYQLYALLLAFFYGGTAWFAVAAAYRLVSRANA